MYIEIFAEKKKKKKRFEMFTIKKTKHAQIITQAVSPVSIVKDAWVPSGPANVELSGIFYKIV